LPNRIEYWPDQTGIGPIDYLVRLAASESLKRIRYHQDLPSFSKVKQAALQLERKHAADTGTSDEGLLRLAEEEIEEQKREIDQLYGALAEEEGRAKAAYEEAQQATSQWHWLKERIALLEGQFGNLGRDVDAELPIPTSLTNVKDWADRNLAGRLIVTAKAARVAKRSVFADPGLVYRALLLLAKEYQLMRIDGGEDRQKAFDEKRRHLGLYNERTGDETRLREQSEEFLVSWNGRKYVLDWHLKNGGNTRDPTRCFRAYYFWDEAKQIVVVGSLPEHLSTRLT
jgi:hypothetical protein